MPEKDPGWLLIKMIHTVLTADNFNKLSSNSNAAKLNAFKAGFH